MAARSTLASATTMAVIGTRAFSDAQGGYGHMMWGGGYGIGGVLVTLVFWGLIVVAIVFAVRWFSTGERGFARGDTALSVLRERFARGEIDEEEFERRRRALDAG